MSEMGPAPNRIGRRAWKGIVVAAAFGVIIGLPKILPEIHVHLIIQILIMALFATSWNLLYGHAGLLSFGHGAHFGIGAYTIALLFTKYKAPFAVAFAAGPIMSVAFALMVGLFVVRRRGLYFAMLTLAFCQLLWVIVFKWYSFTGGDDGFRMTVPGFLMGATNYYFLTLGIVTASLAVIWRITRSPFGLALRTIRESRDRAQAIGIDINRYLVIDYAVAAFFAGIAGALFAPFNRLVFPHLFNWLSQADPVLVTLLGGPYIFLGPTLGAAVFVATEYFVSAHTRYSLFFVGIILLIIVMFFRQGVLGMVYERITAWKTR